MLICNKCHGALESPKALRNHLKSYHSIGAIKRRLKAAKKRAKTGYGRPLWSPLKTLGLPDTNRRRH